VGKRIVVAIVILAVKLRKMRKAGRGINMKYI
jgi:hypothetical protein